MFAGELIFFPSMQLSIYREEQLPHFGEQRLQPHAGALFESRNPLQSIRDVLLPCHAFLRDRSTPPRSGAELLASAPYPQLTYTPYYHYDRVDQHPGQRQGKKREGEEPGDEDHATWANILSWLDDAT